jgi:hypothetical protein
VFESHGDLSKTQKLAPDYSCSDSLRFYGARAFELVMDSGRFGSVDTNITVIYSADKNLAAFAIPTVCRDLHWRNESAGETLTEKNREAAQLSWCVISCLNIYVALLHTQLC